MLVPLGLLGKKTIFKISDQKGMSLIEVLIALLLFSFISWSLFRIVDTTVQYRKKVTRNIKNHKFSQNVGQVVKRDLRNMFYKKDINDLVYRTVESSRKTRSALIKTAEDPAKNSAKQAVLRALAQFELKFIRPHFPPVVRSVGGIIGKKDQLSLNALSYRAENGPQGDPSAIIYYLKNCKSRLNPKEQSLCLWRKSSSVIDQDLEDLTQANEVVLLERMQKFELSYYDVSTKEWVQEWKTGLNEREALPAAIHLKWEFKNSRNHLIQKVLKITLHQQIILPIMR